MILASKQKGEPTPYLTDNQRLVARLRKKQDCMEHLMPPNGGSTAVPPCTTTRAHAILDTKAIAYSHGKTLTEQDHMKYQLPPNGGSTAVLPCTTI